MKYLLIFLSFLPSFSYTQTLENNLDLKFGGTIKENVKTLKTSLFGKTGQFEWYTKVDEIGTSTVYILFEENSLLSALLIKQSTLLETAELFNKCLSIYGQENYINDSDIFSAVLGPSNERNFDYKGVKIKMYLFKHGGYSFFGGKDIRLSVIINLSKI